MHMALGITYAALSFGVLMRGAAPLVLKSAAFKLLASLLQARKLALLVSHSVLMMPVAVVVIRSLVYGCLAVGYLFG